MNDKQVAKHGDIFRWSWNEETRKSKKLSERAGTLYWCCSRICVFKEDNKFWDTYCGGSDYNNDKRFTIEQAETMLDLKYVANFDDLEISQPYKRAYYDDKDCVDLNHANSSRGNFYIKKGAKKSIDKMSLVLERAIEDAKSEAERAKRRLVQLTEELNKLSEDSNFCIPSDVSLFDFRGA